MDDFKPLEGGIGEECLQQTAHKSIAYCQWGGLVSTTCRFTPLRQHRDGGFRHPSAAKIDRALVSISWFVVSSSLIS